MSNSSNFFFKLLGMNKSKVENKYWFLGGLYKDYFAYCSDNRCPCPQVRIPRGEGYIYVVDNGNNSFSANLTCEQGARLRKLDLLVAHNDAKYWWETGLVPYRPTPINEEIQIAPYSNTLNDIDQEIIRKRRRAETLERLDIMLGPSTYNKTDYLFVDTETTGLPSNWKAPYTDSENWPRLVQIAWIEYDSSGMELSKSSFIIRPIGFSIPIEASRIHKISNEMAVQEGKEIAEILNLFIKKVESTKCLVAHNIEFDEKIILAELFRLKLPLESLQKVKKICTMRSTTSFCAIPSNYGDFKWPSLSELYYKTFGTQLQEVHNAETDIKATAECFWELKNRKIIN